MEIIELNLKNIITGIGRRATEKELMEYLLLEINAVPISLEIAFAQYGF